LTSSSRSVLRSIGSSEVAVDRGAAYAMLPAAAARFAPGIEAGYDFAFRIEHLRLAIDPKAAIGIEYANSCSSREERRRVDPVQDRFFEVVVHAFRSKLVVSPGRLLQVFEGHFLVRMPHDFLGELGKRIGPVEISVRRVGI